MQNTIKYVKNCYNLNLVKYDKETIDQSLIKNSIIISMTTLKISPTINIYSFIKSINTF